MNIYLVIDNIPSKVLKICYKTHFFSKMLARYLKTPYLCSVIFS